MAAGFKKATVTSGDVAATLTNYPTYVDLSRLGITTLAEAESVRVYADSGKTTEWAREIVSVTEMHVKVPSLTSTVEIFVDWDGVRADYAVGATYGRNAVWSDYLVVLHMTTSPETNSTGKNAMTVNGTSDVSGQIGRGRNSNAGTHGITADLSSDFASGSTGTISAWVKARLATPTNGSYNMPFGLGFSAEDTNHYPFSNGLAYMSALRKNRVDNISLSATVTRTNWHRLVITTSPVANGWKLYQNKILITQTTGQTFTGSDLGAKLFVALNANLVGIRRWDGDGDEYRVSETTFTSDWLDTEYNNQNAESTFWGTWTDAGGGGGGAAQAARRGAVMMM